mmetsp:Transcript_23801/g.49245  ORF Transcript_23801/g.49245 Transcript_23801/m.49245 type:complete len:207 (+) Transcript_23801:742-1362(+)
MPLAASRTSRSVRPWCRVKLTPSRSSACCTSSVTRRPSRGVGRSTSRRASPRRSAAHAPWSSRTSSHTCTSQWSTLRGATSASRSSARRLRSSSTARGGLTSLRRTKTSSRCLRLALTCCGGTTLTNSNVSSATLNCSCASPLRGPRLSWRSGSRSVTRRSSSSRSTRTTILKTFILDWAAPRKTSSSSAPLNLGFGRCYSCSSVF